MTALMATLASNSEIGIRINPQVGVGAIAATSTATRTSKFGIPLEDAGQRARLIQAYIERPWLTGVHTHVGSQGCSLELIASGVAKVMAFAEEINAAVGRQQVQVLDIGGGLPVNFASDEFTPAMTNTPRSCVPTRRRCFREPIGDYLSSTVGRGQKWLHRRSWSTTKPVATGISPSPMPGAGRGTHGVSAGNGPSA